MSRSVWDRLEAPRKASELQPAEDPEPEPNTTPLPELEEIARNPNELVVDARTGEMRQAGSHQAGSLIQRVKYKAEEDLYFFAKVILRRHYLVSPLHWEFCRFLTDFSSFRRKLGLMPREHCKTSIVSHALPIHILIQPANHNLYFPGEEGCNQRIILAGETEGRAKDHIRVVETALEGNELIKALWPHRVWENPKRESKKWNDRECIIPRLVEYPDPSLRAVGVDGVVTGAHPSVLIKDDLVTLDAANSPTVMHNAIQWHIASRALINSPSCLEFIIGTRWQVHDLYEHIQNTDPTVQIYTRSVVENGEPIYPEHFCMTEEEAMAMDVNERKTSIEYLQKHFGTLFPLMYMNSAADPELVDFDMGDLREYRLVGDTLIFDTDERDDVLKKQKSSLESKTTEEGQAVPTNRHWQKMIQLPGVRLRGGM